MRHAITSPQQRPGISVGRDEDSLTMYASLAIQPPAPSQPATALPTAAAEAQGFGEALRRAVAGPAGLADGSGVVADATAAIPPTIPPTIPPLASAPGTGEPAELVDPAALLPTAFTLAATEPALPRQTKAAADAAEVLEGPSAASPSPDGLAAIPGLVIAPPPMPPAAPAMTVALAPDAPGSANMVPESAPAGMAAAPANLLHLKATSQRGSAAGLLPQAEDGLPAAEAALQTAPLAAQPAPLPPPVLPAIPQGAHALAHDASPHSLAGAAEATAPPDAQAAVLSALSRPIGEAPRGPERAAPMPPARQVMPMAMAMLLSPGTTPTLSVTLDPAELGRLEIRVGREAGGASLRLIAERPETLSLLVRDQRDLQQGLAQSGITLNADGIRFEMAEQDGQARQEQQRRQASRRPQAEAQTSPQQAFQLSLLDIHI
jgi:flagellar hook-length control protein FliK